MTAYRNLSLATCVWLSIAAFPCTGAAEDSCTDGRVVTSVTGGRCCWPGQIWSDVDGRCSGPPQCPAGRTPEGDTCITAQQPLLVPVAPVRAAPMAPSRPLVRTRSIVGLQVAGVVTWASIYLTGIGVTAGVGGDADDIGFMAIPLAGPWVCLSECNDPDPYAWAIILDGSLQAVGFLMLVIGSALHTEQPITTVSLGPDADVTFVPWVGATAAGTTAIFDF